MTTVFQARDQLASLIIQGKGDLEILLNHKGERFDDIAEFRVGTYEFSNSKHQFVYTESTNEHHFDESTGKEIRVFVDCEFDLLDADIKETIHCAIKKHILDLKTQNYTIVNETTKYSRDVVPRISEKLEEIDGCDLFVIAAPLRIKRNDVDLLLPIVKNGKHKIEVLEVDVRK